MTIEIKPLRPYQETTVQRMVERRRHAPFLRMGMGKTVVTVNAIHRSKAKRILILCRRNGISGWIEHLTTWLPHLSKADNQQWGGIEIFVQPKDQSTRLATWRQRFTQDNVIRVFIMTHQCLVVDALTVQQAAFKQPFDAVIVDEAKRIFTVRPGTHKLFKALKPICSTSTYFWPMTGSRPQHVGYAFTTLNLIDHKRYSSYHKLLNTYSIVQKTPWGGNEILGVRNPEQWNRIVAHNFTVIGPEDVPGEMPEKQRTLIKVELTAEQRRIYQDFDGTMMSYLKEADRILFTKNSLERLIRWRQLFICPKILDNSLGYGAALEDLGDQLEELDGAPAVIYTPFKRALPYIDQYLSSRSHQHIYHLYGGLSVEELDRRRRAYKQTNGIILCTILYATSFELQPAQHCYFLDREWDPEDNDQAEARLVRLDNKDRTPITAHYYCYQNTEDEALCEEVAIKQIMINDTMDMGALKQRYAWDAERPTNKQRRPISSS